MLLPKLFFRRVQRNAFTPVKLLNPTPYGGDSFGAFQAL